MKKLIAILTLIIASQSYAAGSKKVLVVLSSENKITLRDGVIHPTGFFLSELMVPVLSLIQAGFEPVFASPKGNEPTMDKVSDNAFWFGGSATKYSEVRQKLSQFVALKHPLTLREVRAQNLSQYAGIFVPGGHAPMEDLLKDRDLGVILRYFHQNHKPTAFICHGPIALLSTLPDPDAYQSMLAEKSRLEAQGNYSAGQALAVQLQALSNGWIYQGYELTAFSTKEEQQEELGGQDKVLGGYVKFYPDEALAQAGARTLVNAVKWKSNVRVDRELITGQNPFSDEDLAKALVKALQK